MNIQQYYQQSAVASINAGIVALIPALLLVLYSTISQNYQLILLIIPFLIYSFFCYQKNVLNNQRAKLVKIPAEKEEGIVSLFQEKELLITFLPSPSLRLLLFSPNGWKVGEIREESFHNIRWFLPNFLDRGFEREYGFYNQEEELIAIFQYKGKQMDILTPNGEKIDGLLIERKGKNKEFHFENWKVEMEKVSLNDFNFSMDSGIKKAQIKSGWMPLEWSNRFINPNTPILRIDENIPMSELVKIYSLLVDIYAYENH